MYVGGRNVVIASVPIAIHLFIRPKHAWGAEREIFFPSFSPDFEKPSRQKVDELFQNITGGRDFAIKAGLGEATIPKHALSVFYHASKYNEAIVDPSGQKLKVIIELKGTHPAPPVPVPTAAQDHAGTTFQEQGLWKGALRQLQRYCDVHLECDVQTGTFKSFSQQVPGKIDGIVSTMIETAKVVRGENSGLQVLFPSLWTVKIKDKIKNS